MVAHLRRHVIDVLIETQEKDSSHSDLLAERHVDVTHLAAPSPILHSAFSALILCLRDPVAGTFPGFPSQGSDTWTFLARTAAMIPTTSSKTCQRQRLHGQVSSRSFRRQRRVHVLSVFPVAQLHTHTPCLPVLHRSVPQNDAAQPATAPRPQPGSAGAKRVVSFLVPLKTDALGAPDEEEVSQHARRLVASLAHTHEHL
jgi:hypothetical protein